LYALATVGLQPKIIEVDTQTLAASTFTTNVGACVGVFAGLTISPDGSRLYSSGSCLTTGGSIFVYDVASHATLSTVSANGIGGLAMSPDGSKLVTGEEPQGFITLLSYDGPTTVRDATSLAILGSVTPSGQAVGVDPSGARAYTFGLAGGSDHTTQFFRITAVNLSTYALETDLLTGSVSTGGFAVAPASPCGQFLASPAYSSVTTTGGAGSFNVPVPAGCPWSVTTTDPWITITSPASGIGPASIAYSAAASSGPRTAQLTVNGQALTVYQTQPLVMIDTPAQGSHVKQGFQIGGWVADLAATSPVNGVLTDNLLVHVWAYPSNGGAPTFLGQTNASVSRPDVAAVFPGYRSGGFNVPVAGLKPGGYTFVTYLFSPYTNTFAAARTVAVTIDPSAFTVIDSLQPNASVTAPFVLSGWALDASATSGSGVDAVNVYAYPDSGAAPILAGTAVYGSPRGDLQPYFGASFINAGFGLAVDGLTPGGYTMVAYAHSTVTGAFTPAVVHVTVTGAAEPLEIESMGPCCTTHGFGTEFMATGWAIDRRAPSGIGVAALQAWAYPIDGRSPIFLGTAFLGLARPDVAAIYGSRYLNAGWSLHAFLPSGTYDVVFFELSAATGQFDNVRVRRIVFP
jgi:hypothetical protein